MQLPGFHPQLPFGKSIIGTTWRLSFGFRHSLVIRHSSFVIDQHCFAICHLPEHIGGATDVINNVVRL